MDALDRDSRRLLKRVSRAFYLSIRVLPRGVGAEVGAAYLLARTADTIADSGALPASERAERLAAFRRAITDGANAWDADLRLPVPTPQRGRVRHRRVRPERAHAAGDHVGVALQLFGRVDAADFAALGGRESR